MSALHSSQPLEYRDRAADAAASRTRARGFLLTYCAVPAVILSALAGVFCYFVGTCCLVFAAALCADSFLPAAFTLVGGFAAFAAGVALMLLADHLERISN